MKLSRRRFMQGLSATASSSVLPLSVFAQNQTQNKLRVPALYAGEIQAGSHHYSLQLQVGTSQFLGGLTTPTLGINGSFLGPTLRLKNGSDVAISVLNQLNEPSTIHWHGLHVPAKVDGGPALIIEPGATWEPAFTVRQKAGTFWYHSHLLNKTGEQVYKGLAGMIIIDDEESENLEIPSTYGVDDIPLIVQDRRFNEDGSFRYVGMHRDVMTGVFGDRILVNGTTSALFTPSTNKVRFRILNAANARTFNFALADGREFSLIASDGGFLEKPVRLRNIVIAPAERAEIVVDFSDGNPVDLISLPLDASSPFSPTGMMRNMLSMNTESFTILNIEPESMLQRSAALPDQLTSIRRMQAGEATRIRRFELSMPMGMGRGGGRGRGGMGGEFLINGKPMAMDEINEVVPIGSTEIWEIHNDSMMMHPFHIHHGQFQILDRDGVPPSAEEMGFKDTVKVGPGQTVRFIMRFENFSDPDTAYMYHCHILEHEDNGMMGQFTVL
ncbi:MAG: multicopper oxidase domain-containing protein [Gammaproteobacteria bacterium]|nr:multicopper oxidase domain-containing protein [Gammaproteobacteria bacterium]